MTDDEAHEALITKGADALAAYYGTSSWSGCLEQSRAMLDAILSARGPDGELLVLHAVSGTGNDVAVRVATGNDVAVRVATGNDVA